jgi:RHS repeat-associated protein
MKEMQNDNNGDTTHSGANSFSYDSENHLMGMNAGTVTLLYDGDGNRVAKTVGSVTTRYLVDDLNPTGLPQVVDELVGGAVTRQYTYGLDRISENQFVGGAWTPSFYGVDGGGSVRQLTNSSGTVTDTYEYDAFGNKVNSTGTTPNNYLYRGEQFDPDLSLYYLRARYYNQVTGRFLNVDPLAGQGQRRYEYAGANPVDGSDPSGNFVLASYWPLMAPLQINIPFPSWCSQAGSGTMGSDLPPCKDHPMLGVGIELPAPKAVHNNVFNPAVDYGHTFLYLKGDYGDILSIFSFGPIDPAPPHELSHFLAGTLPGNGHWHLDPVANTWSFPISEDQLFNGVIDIDAFKANPPNYTPTFQCTSAAVSMAAKIGVSLPSGVGPTKARKYLHTFYNGQVANPYHLNQQMTSEFGPPTVVNTNTFPNP